MHTTVTFRDESFRTQPLVDYIHSEISKYDRILKKEPTPVYLDVVVEPHNVHQYHRVSVKIKTPHFDLFADAEEDDIYRAVKQATDSMHHQLRREQEKLVDHYEEGCGKACQEAYADMYRDKTKKGE